MTIYKYSNVAEAGYFTNFATIKSKIHRGDTIVFGDKAGSGMSWQKELQCIPYYEITSSSTVANIQTKIFNLSGFKVQITMNKSKQITSTGRWSYWQNANASFTLDCRKLEASKANFLIGYFRKYDQSNLTLASNEKVSMDCLNIVSLPSDTSLKGLEDRRIFVIPKYGEAYSTSNPAGAKFFDATADILYGKRMYVSYTDPQTSYSWSLKGGAGFYGGKVINQNNISGGTEYLLTPTSERPASYMTDWETYANIIKGSIQLKKTNDDVTNEFVFEIKILATPTEPEIKPHSSFVKYFDGNELVDCTIHYVDPNNPGTFKCDAYYFDGTNLIKI